MKQLLYSNLEMKLNEHLKSQTMIMEHIKAKSEKLSKIGKAGREGLRGRDKGKTTVKQL